MERTKLYRAFALGTDGSLPEIEIEFERDEDKSEVVTQIVANSKPQRQGKTLWDKSEQSDIECEGLNDERLVNLLCDGQHIGIASFSDLPDLGITVWEKGLSIDFRTGEQWSADKVDGFLEFLLGIKSRFPSVKISLDKDEESFSLETRTAFSRVIGTNKLS